MTDQSGTLPIYTINVGTAGAYTNDANVNIAPTVNAEIAAAPKGYQLVINFYPGTYGMHGGPILLPSNTSVIGSDSTLQYIQTPGSQDNGAFFTNADTYNSGDKILINNTNGTHAAVQLINGATDIYDLDTAGSPIIDNNILIKGMTFNDTGESDFITNLYSNFGTWFTGCTNVDVQNNTYIGGGDGNAFVDVVNGLVANNIAVGQINCAYDNWNGPSNITVENNTSFIGSPGYTSGWSVLINSTPTGDSSNSGNASNDAIINNQFSSNDIYATAVLIMALTGGSQTAESNITEQGNVDSNLNTPDTLMSYAANPISNLLTEDNVFTGVVETPGYNRHPITAGYQGGLSSSTLGPISNTTISGNLILGSSLNDTQPLILNQGDAPSTTNNAILNDLSLQSNGITTIGSNGTSNSEGNIVNSGTAIWGSELPSKLTIQVSPTLFAPTNTVVPVGELSISDANINVIISVTLTTQFGTLSLPTGMPGVEYGIVGGQKSIILTGDNASINEDLAQLTYVSNANGWDDAVEIQTSDSSGASAIRYLPITVGNTGAGDDQVIIIPPGLITASPPIASTFPGQTLPAAPNLSGDIAIASTGDNVLSMGSTISIAFLGTGNDTIEGGSNDEYISTGSGNALINLDGAGDVTVSGGSGSMTVNAATGSNLIEVGSSTASIKGGIGSTTVIGGLGNFLVQGGSGPEYIATLPQDGGDMTADLGTGNSTVFALSGNNTISTEADTSNIIYTELGSDFISSGGSDTIYAGVGSDTVETGLGGADTVYGGTGPLYLQRMGESADTSDIFLGNSTNSLNLIGYGSEPILSEVLLDTTIHVTLLDGTNIYLSDLDSNMATVANGTLGLVLGSSLNDETMMNIDNLPGINTDAGANNAIMISQALATVPQGYRAILNSSGLINNGIIVLDPASMTINGPLTGAGDIEIATSSELTLNASASSGQTISFTNDTGKLILGDPAEFSGEVGGINGSDIIELSNVPFDSLGTAYVTSNNVLNIVEKQITTKIQLNPFESYSGVVFHLFKDGLNGTDVTEASVPCFLRNTRIMTPSGNIMVENLKIGDLVSTIEGPARPIKWIGKRKFSNPPPDNPDVIPIIIKEHALGENSPDSDLMISPLHGLLIDGFIVPAGALINRMSILTCDSLNEIEYFHIELDDHGIIFANNTPAETFIDWNSRNMFDNAAEYYKLHPRPNLATSTYYAPRLEGGDHLERIRCKIAARTGALFDHLEGQNIVGYLESVDRQTFVGWAFDTHSPHVPVTVDILNCGAILARTVANIPRMDVKRAGFGSGRCGFSVTLPAPLPALRRHEISVRPTLSADCIAGSPYVIDPAISEELLRTGGLQVILDTAARSLGSDKEVMAFGTALTRFGDRLMMKTKSSSAHSRKPDRLAGSRREETVLILDQNWPTVRNDAGSNALMSHIKAFQSLGYNVVFCAASGEPANEAAQEGYSGLMSLDVECHGQDGASAEVTIRLLAEKAPNYVYLHRLAMMTDYAGLIRHYIPSARLIYALADLHHLRLARQAEITSRPDLALKAEAIKEAEIWAMRISDCVITHSRFEESYLTKILPGANVHLIPWDVRATGEVRRKRDARNIAFIGGAGHAPNVDAVEYLINQVMPSIWRIDGRINCYVIGAEWPQRFFEGLDARIICLGHQIDLARTLKSVRLTVAPVRFGAGIKGKVLESMAAGIPCIMSSCAAEGVPLDPHLRSAVADGPEFAIKILEIYSNPKTQRMLSRSGLDMVQTYFSEESVLTGLKAALDYKPSVEKEFFIDRLSA